MCIINIVFIMANYNFASTEVTTSLYSTSMLKASVMTALLSLRLCRSRVIRTYNVVVKGIV